MVGYPISTPMTCKLYMDHANLKNKTNHVDTPLLESSNDTLVSFPRKDTFSLELIVFPIVDLLEYHR